MRQVTIKFTPSPEAGDTDDYTGLTEESFNAVLDFIGSLADGDVEIKQTSA